MKNTLENKAKFLLIQYAYNPSSIKSHHGSGVVFGILDIINNPEHYYFEGKPLSSISDADAIEVSFLNWEVFRHINKSCIKVVRDFDGVKVFIKTNDNHHRHDISEWNNDIFASDYLRSKGYVLPWNGITVEEMISFGWIILI